MSLIVAVKDDKRNEIIVGCDSIVSIDETLGRLDKPKFVCQKNVIICVAGSYLAIEKAAEIVYKIKRQVIDINNIIVKLLKICRDYDLRDGTSFLVCHKYNGNMKFVIIMNTENYPICVEVDDYIAIGATREYATGAINAAYRHSEILEKYNISWERIIQETVKISSSLARESSSECTITKI